MRRLPAFLLAAVLLPPVAAAAEVAPEALVERFAPSWGDRARYEHGLRRHLKDSLSCLPDPGDVLAPNLAARYPRPAAARVSGALSYVGGILGPYRYRFVPQAGGSVKVVVSIGYLLPTDGREDGDSLARQLSEEELQGLAASVRGAQAYWNSARPAGSPFVFEFIFGPDSRRADFTVLLHRERVRGPYFHNWSVQWSANTVAHEVGHMLGLNDEYETLTGDISRCDPASLLCDSRYGALQPQHYYFVLRRYLCPVPPPSAP